MKKFITKKIQFIFYSYFLLPITVLAAGTGQNTGGSPDVTLQNPLNSNSIEELLAKLLEIITKIGLPIIVIFFIYAGFKFITAQGNSEKLIQARKAFQWTAIGAAVLLGANALATLINGTINIF